YQQPVERFLLEIVDVPKRRVKYSAAVFVRVRPGDRFGGLVGNLADQKRRGRTGQRADLVKAAAAGQVRHIDAGKNWILRGSLGNADRHARPVAMMPGIVAAEN